MHAPWAASVAACVRYLGRPNTPDLFRVFNPLTAYPALWCGDARDGQPDPDEGFRRFESALADGSAEAARMSARVLEAASRTPAERATVRFALAARAVLVHDRVDVADAVLGGDLARADRGAAVALDRFLLRMRCRVRDTRNADLLHEVLQQIPECAAVALVEHVRHCWRFEGASERLLDRLLGWGESLPSLLRQALHGECLALAFRVDATAVIRRLLDPERLPSRIARRLLPLAAYLRTHGTPKAWRRHQVEIDAMADLCEHLAAERVRLIDEVSDARHAVALVGNSACELGMRQGARIDAHDLVIRFNHYALDSVFTPDYGTRADLHVRGGSDDPELTARSLRTGRAILCQFDFEYLPRNWVPLVTLRREGVRLTTLPPGFHHDLQRELGAEPSLGLTMCAFVHAVRGELPASACFGFSFTDQVSGLAPRVRYFGNAPPAMTHRWTAERRIFERLQRTRAVGVPDRREVPCA